MHVLNLAKQRAYSVMNILNLAKGHRVGRGHGCGVLQVCDQEGQLAGIADGIQLLLLRISSYVHQAMHQPLQLFHLATLGLCLFMSPHQPETKQGAVRFTSPYIRSFSCCIWPR